jgi:hypothetical protein
MMELASCLLLDDVLCLRRFFMGNAGAEMKFKNGACPFRPSTRVIFYGHQFSPVCRQYTFLLAASPVAPLSFLLTTTPS